jgi:hypothetical protein
MPRKRSREEAEAQAALNELRERGGIPTDALPGMGPPGVPQNAWDNGFLFGGVQRLHGKFATLTFGSISLLCYEWEVSVDQEFVDGTAHGEYWDYPVPIKQMWTGSVRCYFNSIEPSANAGSAAWNAFMLGSSLIYNASRIDDDPGFLVFNGYNTMLFTHVDRAIFRGNCLASRSNFNAPRTGMVTQEYVMRGLGAPLIGPFATPAF